MSGLNFPVGRWACWGRSPISIIPLAVGLDAMRQLAFADATYRRHAAARRRGADPGRHDGRLHGFARLMPAQLERMARSEGRLSVRGR